VRRSFTKREHKHPKTEASRRAVPLQARALDVLDRIEDGNGSPPAHRDQPYSGGSWCPSRAMPPMHAAMKGAPLAAPPSGSGYFTRV
jgi:hypothetical protein